MRLAWFWSGKLRSATNYHRQVFRDFHVQRDLLTLQATEQIQRSLTELKAVLKTGSDGQIDVACRDLEEVAKQHLRTYSLQGFRELFETLLVALLAAIAFRTFFFQPFRIPTGSMQPTLNGITVEDLRGQDVPVPTGLDALWELWVNGARYYHITARTAGRLERVEPPERYRGIYRQQRFTVGGTEYTVRLPRQLPPKGFTVPDYLFVAHAGIKREEEYKVGEDIVKLKVTAGDHLFVNRVTYNFRRPQRGEIVVFETQGVSEDLPPDQFYVKRLVALPNERVRIGDDRHLIINGQRLDASTQHFENVYIFDGPPRDSVFSGHVNAAVAEKNGQSFVSPFFANGEQEFLVRPGYCLVMGDNTLNSFDSRAWGDFPQTNIIGQTAFVYWPISKRFGWSHR